MKWRYAKVLFQTLFLQVIISSLACSLFSTLVIQGVWNPVQLSTMAVSWILHPTWLWNLPYHAIFLVLFTRMHVHSYTSK